MIKYAIAYLGTALTIAVLDAAWLSYAGPKLYRPALGDLLTEGFRLGPAIAFYVLYVAGIVIFAVRPALASGRWTEAVLMGALFGIFCYATYDLTNMATLKVWPMHITLMDIAWGAFLTGAAAFAGFWAARKFG